MNFSFAYPWVLLFLVLVPLLAAWQFAPRFRRIHQSTFTFSALGYLSRRTPGVRQQLRYAADVMQLLALALIIIALARPQAVDYLEQHTEGIDIFVALDLSGSMRAIDANINEVQRLERQGKEPLNRFDAANVTLKEFIGAREHDRIGIVLFAKDAYLQFPLTLDYPTILESLDELQIGDIDEDGTAIGNAIARAVAGLQHSDAKTRILILITDGDRRGGNISPKQAAEMARELGIVIYPILVGRDGPVLVPAGRNFLSGQTTYRAVEFPIDPELLQDIAQSTGGRYFRAEDGLSMREDLQNILDDLEQSRQQDLPIVIYDERFVPLVMLALILLAIQFLLRHTYCRSFN